MTALSSPSPLPSPYLFSSLTLHFIVFFIKVFWRVLPVPAKVVNGAHLVSQLRRCHYLLTSVFPVQVLFYISIPGISHFFLMNNCVILYWGFESKYFCVIEAPR